MKNKQSNESFSMITTDTKEVATQIKNKELVKERRRQIVDAAVPLFIERGYHKTTTRDKAFGVSPGYPAIRITPAIINAPAARLRFNPVSPNSHAP